MKKLLQVEQDWTPLTKESFAIELDKLIYPYAIQAENKKFTKEEITQILLDFTEKVSVLILRV